MTQLERDRVRTLARCNFGLRKREQRFVRDLFVRLETGAPVILTADQSAYLERSAWRYREQLRFFGRPDLVPREAPPGYGAPGAMRDDEPDVRTCWCCGAAVGECPCVSLICPECGRCPSHHEATCQSFVSLTCPTCGTPHRPRRRGSSTSSTPAAALAPAGT